MAVFPKEVRRNLAAQDITFVARVNRLRVLFSSCEGTLRLAVGEEKSTPVPRHETAGIYSRSRERLHDRDSVLTRGNVDLRVVRAARHLELSLNRLVLEVLVCQVRLD